MNVVTLDEYNGAAALDFSSPNTTNIIFPFRNSSSPNFTMEELEIIDQNDRNFKIYIIFAVLSTVANICLLVTTMRKKRKTKLDNFFAGFSLGSTLLGIAYTCDYARMITYQTSDDTILKGYCIFIAIHPTFYAVGDVFISGATLIMAFESVLALQNNQQGGPLKALLLNKFPLIYYTTVSVVDVSLCWTDILTNNEPVPIACYYELVVSQTYFNIHLAYTGTVGFVGVLIFVAWLLYMPISRSSHQSVRAVQTRRNWEMVRKVVMLIALNFSVQNLPATYRVFSTIFLDSTVIPFAVWLMQPIGFLLTAIFRLIELSKIRTKLQKALLLKFKKSVMPSHLP
ncbi:hypothetical protein T03_7940 [Trichinella britovi]|uniref:G-protein coupled receptors family 1 profile domain-containing protein n=1 Tax=Trichinella britovi TaxID=45882 RepID=A0A0V1CL66_TRIBR|nr:hypothetical protein T09_3401 [Trichinella sp. T9]KRY50027.1 hypothetical protein T03_7940 [Trichinella britovi]